MFCSKCGREVADNASFCQSCGFQMKPDNVTSTPTNQPISAPKNKWTVFLLCLFLGGLGVHRFYVGKVGTGILYLLTFGLFGIGVLVDLVLILLGNFKDGSGQLLTGSVSGSSAKGTAKGLKVIFIGVGVIVFLVIIGAILGGGDTSTPSTTSSSTSVKSETKKVPKLEVLDHKTITESYVRYVTGTIRNNTSREYSYVQVEINLYDSSGAQVGSTLANMNNLEPNGLWKFKAPILEENATSYKIKDVTGF